MLYLVLKTAISALIIVAVAEIAKRAPHWGGLLAALPIVSLMALTWLYVDTRDEARVAALAWSILLMILPTLVFFVALPLGLKAGLGFALSLGLAALVTALAFALWRLLMLRLGLPL